MMTTNDSLPSGLFVMVRGSLRVGMVSGYTKGGRVRVLFGPDGPCKYYHAKNLLTANKADVIEAGLQGVGGLVFDGHKYVESPC